MRIGDLLIQGGFISEIQLERALELQRTQPEKKIGELLVELGYVSSGDIIDTLKKQ